MIAVRHIAVDCRDAAALAGFWSAALDQPVDDGANPYFASIGMAFRSRRPAWIFLQVPEGKTAKNRLHVDFAVGETGTSRAEAVSRLVALGATEVEQHSEYGTDWTVLTDPEGNEFCVGEPTPTNPT